MEYSIKITGSGTNEQIAASLRAIADDIEIGAHVDNIEEKGEVEWEDAILFTEISESFEE